MSITTLLNLRGQASRDLGRDVANDASRSRPRDVRERPSAVQSARSLSDHDRGGSRPSHHARPSRGVFEIAGSIFKEKISCATSTRSIFSSTPDRGLKNAVVHLRPLHRLRGDDDLVSARDGCARMGQVLELAKGLRPFKRVAAGRCQRQQYVRAHHRQEMIELPRLAS